MKRALAPLALAFLPACAWDEGHGFSTIDGASVGASFEPESARSVDDSVMTDLGYVVTPQDLSLQIDSVELEAADPPAFQSVVSLEVGRTLDLLAHESASGLTPLPSAELPKTELERTSVAVSRVQLRLIATGAELGAETLELDVDVPLSLEASGDLAFTVDQGAPQHVSVDVQLRYGAELFDALDFAALGAGSLTLDDPDDPLVLQLSTNLSAADVTATIAED